MKSRNLNETDHHHLQLQYLKIKKNKKTWMPQFSKVFSFKCHWLHSKVASKGVWETQLLLLLTKKKKKKLLFGILGNFFYFPFVISSMGKLGFWIGALMMCVMVLLQKSDGTQFIVGGAKGWGIQNYNQWAEANRFQIGDSLGINIFFFNNYSWWFI